MIALDRLADVYLRARGTTLRRAQSAGWLVVSGSKARELGSPYAADAILIPYPYPFDTELVHERLVRFRYLTDPLPTDRDGKPVKFAQPRGSDVEAWFDPHIDWRRVAKDPSIPVYFVEGEVKALAMNQREFATIGLGGVDNFGGEKLTPWLREVLQ